MRAALRKANLEPAALDYINAHATATRGGDPVEVSALKEVLGTAATTVPVSGTKALHGHLLGAASAMEALVCILSMKNSFLPGTAFMDEIDPECAGVHHLQQTIKDRSVRHALTLSAGFGGTNVALVLGHA
jgi:3-oxoacyl-(acyl-carrier-protein) synthase